MPADADDRSVDLDRAPGEPPITADPLVLREPAAVIRGPEPAELGSDDSWTETAEPQLFVPLPPDLPPPIVLDEPMLNPAEVLLDEPAPSVMPPPACRPCRRCPCRLFRIEFWTLFGPGGPSPARNAVFWWCVVPSPRRELSSGR